MDRPARRSCGEREAQAGSIAEAEGWKESLEAGVGQQQRGSCTFPSVTGYVGLEEVQPG